MDKNICSVGDCGSSVHGRSMCLKHYRRWHRHGSPSTVLITKHAGDARQRFWAKVDKTADCWNWVGPLDSGGYGKHYVDGKLQIAHRFSYELATGTGITDGMQVDHRCHNKRCVRPDHLRLATPSQNNQNYQSRSTKAASGVRGVSWSARRGMWRARVQHNGECVYYQWFSTVEEAAVAVAEARNRIHTHNDYDRQPTKNPLGTTAGD